MQPFDSSCPWGVFCSVDKLLITSVVAPEFVNSHPNPFSRHSIVLLVSSHTSFISFAGEKGPNIIFSKTEIERSKEEDKEKGNQYKQSNRTIAFATSSGEISGWRKAKVTADAHSRLRLPLYISVFLFLSSFVFAVLAFPHTHFCPLFTNIFIFSGKTRCNVICVIRWNARA